MGEDQRKKAEAEKKAAEEEVKKKQMEEAEIKRQEMMAAQKEGGKKSSGPAMDARKEMSKTKEQVEEEMKISLRIRIKPLDLDSMDSDELKQKAQKIFDTILQLETDKYDYEQRQLDQDYELKELAERQKLQQRNKAIKKGLDPESFTQKHPPQSGCSPSTRGGRTQEATATARSCTRVEPKSLGPSGWSQTGRRSSPSSRSVPPRNCQSGSESDQAKRPAIRRHPRVRRKLQLKRRLRRNTRKKRRKKRRRKRRSKH